MDNNNTVALSVINSGNISSLPVERQEKITTIKNSIDLSYQNTMEFGNEASDQLKEFSTGILQNVKVKDVPEVDSLLNELTGEIAKVDPDTLMQAKPNFFQRLFKVDTLKNFIMKYDDVSSAMVDIKNRLAAAQFQIQKDIEVCDNYIQQDYAYINDLDDYIMAGTIKVNELKDEILKDEAIIEADDQLALQTLNRKKEACDRLERKIFNLKTMRQIAIQNIPQIGLIQNGDLQLIEQIQTSIDSAIPLWEAQVVIAITIARQKGALEMQQAVSKLINETIKTNSDLIKTNAIEIARQLDAGLIDQKSISYSNQNLIETIKGVKQVREEGIKKRQQAEQELEENQKKLYNLFIESK